MAAGNRASRGRRRTDRIADPLRVLLLPALLAACSDDFLERVQSTSDDLDAWVVEKGIVEPTPQSAEPVYRQGLALKRQGALGEAAARFHEAADAGHGAAAFELSEAYRQGDGVTRDQVAAAEWRARAADRGDPRAQYLLGAAYYGGLGVKQDDRLALQWLGKAATQGHDRAQFLLAEAFANGRGVEADMAWAARWYGKAARQGHPEAQLAYGLLNVSGRGLPVDLVRGYTWLAIAARNGQSEAESARALVAEELDPAHRSTADADAARFRPGPNTRFADPPTVMYVQFRLNGLGFPTGPVDGLMGPQTRSGIHAYQRTRNRAADGQVTPDLLIALLRERHG